MNAKTHEISNQVAVLADYNLYQCDPLLQSAIRVNASEYDTWLDDYGARMGSEEMIRHAELAEACAPQLQTHDRNGRRIDVVEFHPAWHALLAQLRNSGLITLPFNGDRPCGDRPGATGRWVAYAAGMYLHGQIDAGSLCPTTMTMAAVPVLQQEPELFASLMPKLFSRTYDARDIPVQHKQSMQIGMGMTEKQGGSDLRSNTTQARPVNASGRGAEYLLVGHKWFFSAPMCDAHLVLAQTEGGPSCFYVPRWRADGTKNPIHIQRLKDKLGDRSNSSSEVEFQDASATMVGTEGRGIPTIIAMANYSRLACVIGSAALMRQALVQAVHHARQRQAFGRALVSQPLMTNVLADMALESEAATHLMVRLALAFEADHDAATATPSEHPLQRGWRRIMMPAAKFWVCKRAIALTGEAMEVWGGNGYVETGPMARLYRQAPVNSIWEGSGNVICLDVLRAISRDPDAAAALFDDLHQMGGSDPRILTNLATLGAMLKTSAVEQEMGAREFSRLLVLTAQGCLLLLHAPEMVAHAFMSSRFHAGWGQVFGTLPLLSGLPELINRAYPG